jgi:hypothetical protein
MKLADIVLSGELLKKLLLAVALGTALILAIEPNHTEGLPILAAFALWYAHLLFGAGIFLLGAALLQRLACPAPYTALVPALILPLPFALVSLVVDYGFGNAEDDLADATTAGALILDEITAVAPLAWALALMVIFLLRQPPDQPTLPEEPQDDAPVPPVLPVLSTLIESAPAKLGDDIISLHASDHYVELVTTEGRALLTEQFGDCLEKLKDLNGLQCHRSHWISLPHVASVSRKGSAYLCTMSNGEQVPVSRRRYVELRDRIGKTV